MPGELLAGRYRLLEPLGRGAMSAVWLADDEELGRQVAVKTLKPTADRARFEREARAAASLSHPNICGLYDYGTDRDRPYMVLEYLAGGSLEDRLRSRHPLPDDETWRIAREIAAGLAHAHEHGLVHRDLKPANVLFDGEGRAKIADFGIARMGGAGTLTEAGTVLGTASTISPEQAAGEPAGPPSDVYSFGVILFRMLTGRLPFTASDPMELVRMHRDEPAPPVAAFRDDAPPQLERLAAAALSKDPVVRPSDGAALLAALAAGDTGDTAATMLLGPDTAATQIVPPARPRRSRRVPIRLAAAAVLLATAGVALAVVATHHGDQPGGKPPAPAPLSLPSVPAGHTTTTLPATTEPATTSAPTTTARHPTTRPTTTAATTTASVPPAPPPTTTTPPATTAPPATTTAPPPATTTEPTTAPTTTAAPAAATTAPATTTGP